MEDVEVGVRLELAESLPRVRVDPSLLRQVFMVVFGYLVGNTERATICVAGHLLESEVHVSISVEPHEGVHSSDSQAAQELLVELRELSALADLQICPRRAGCCVGGFDLRLPAAERIVLVVDDNADMLQLFEGFLFRHNYRVVTASAAEEVLTLARQFQPYAITLDLMMAGRDGWDLLQQIRNEPDTHHIPIIVCTVLRQKELSLSLGASAYLQKPVTEHELLTALESLDNP
jgi:CheY-like chemotaxis protein